MDEVERLGKGVGVAGGGGLEVAVGDRHRPDPGPAAGREAVEEMDEVAPGITVGEDALVDLEHVDALPGNLLAGQKLEHPPGGAAAAHGEREAAPVGDRVPGGPGDLPGAAGGGGLGVGEDLEPHAGFSSCPPNCLRMAERILSA